MTLQQELINKLMGVEGGYSDRKDDRGGKTNYGITIQTARQYGYTGDMQDLTQEFAFSVYVSYWDKMKLTEIYNITNDAHFIDKILNIGVNQGISTANKYLQRSLNAMNNKQAYYADIAVDGMTGNNTLKALKAFFIERGRTGIEVLYATITIMQGERYISLAEHNQSQESNIYGWILQRIVKGITYD